MGDLHLVLPALNLSSLDADILIQVGLNPEHGGVLHVHGGVPLTVHQNFLLWYPSMAPSCLKVIGGWVGCGPHDFSVSPSPLGTKLGI